MENGKATTTKATNKENESKQKNEAGCKEYKQDKQIKRNKKKKQEKKQTLVATWNVKTLLRIGKMEETAKEIQKYNVDITAVQEIRWEKSGEIRKDKYTFLYSGEEKRGHNGVGFYVNEKLRNNIIQFLPVNGRIAVLRLKMNKCYISFINVYAPTEGSEQDQKDNFYDTLNKICEEIPKKDEIILLGDVNAQVGKEIYLREVVRNENGTIHDETNDNGQRLCQLAETFNMTFLSTRFNHPRKHKVTWRHPVGNIENQIDHIMATKGISKKTINTRTYRGAQAETDHYLVITKIRNLKSTKKYIAKQNIKRWEVEKLENTEIRKKYEEIYTKNIQNQTSNTNKIEEKWTEIKNNIIRTAEAVLQKTQIKTIDKEWFNQECEEARKEKNIARTKWINTKQKEYREDYERKRNKANAIYKRKKNEWISKTLEDIDLDGRSNKTKQFYKKIKSHNHKPRTKTRGMKDKEGNLEHDPQAIGNIWKEYYQQMLNDTEKSTITEGEDIGIQEAEEEEEEMECPTEAEVQEEIKRLRNGKAPGEDQIEAELLKYGGQQMLRQIHSLIEQIWRKNKIPEEWNIGLITPIHKKADKEACKNYRTITLLNVAYKILANLINKKLKMYAEKILGDYQNGFRPGKSTIDAIHTMDQIHQKAWEHNREHHVIFIDFKSAFDSIKRDKMIKELEILQVPKKLRTLIEVILQNTKAKVRFQGVITGKIQTNKGLKQGDPISPTLFNIVLEGIMRRAKLHNKNIIINNIQVVAYADDVTIISNSQNDLIKAIDKLEMEAKKFGLDINQEKTKYMKIGREFKDDKKYLKTQRNKFELVHSFNYLGVTIGQTSKHRTKERIQKGYRAVGRNKKLLKSKSISRRTKIKIYKTLIRPVITYAMETTVINKKEEEDLKITERKIIRMITGPNVTGEGERRLKTNKEIEEILGGENIVRYIKTQRLNWAGHIMRRKPTDTIRRITEWIPLWPRRRGRPRRSWRNDIEDDLKRLGITDWRRKCKDRKEWKKITKLARTHNNL